MIRCSLFLSGALVMASCSSSATVAGHTSSELFPDGNARELADAACDGDAEEVSKLARDKRLVNYSGVEGTTPLMWAVNCHSVEGVKALLEAGADPNQSALGANPLSVAAAIPDSPLLELLLDAGADPNRYPDESNLTPLRRAFDVSVATDSDFNLKLLLENGADVNLPSGGAPVIEMAAYVNRFNEAALMLDYGFRGDIDDLIATAEHAISLGLTPQFEINAEKFLEKARKLKEIRQR